MLGDRQHLSVVCYRRDAYNVVVLIQRNSSHTGALPALRSKLGFREADRHTLVGSQEYLPVPVRDLRGYQFVALVNSHRDDAADPDICKSRKLGLLDGPFAGRHHHVLAFLELANGNDACELLARRNIHKVNNSLAPARRGRIWNLVNLEPVHLAVTCKDHYIAVRRSDEDVIDDIICLRGSAFSACAAASLRTIDRNRRPLDVASVCHGDVSQNRLVREYLLEFGDKLDDFFVLVDKLLTLEAGQLLQLHFKDCARLKLGELESLHQSLASFGRAL